MPCYTCSANQAPMSENGPKIRLVLLWHMHQPFYKDMVTGEYRLPWVRLHALKDYYGMVRLAEEFPDVHQTFNLVPSLITQILDYVSGDAHDPFLDLVSKPATELTVSERRFALQYLFQSNPANMIGRYPRYWELLERYRATIDRPEGPESYFVTRDYADLQVLSQLAWFDEYVLTDPEVAAVIQKGEDFSRDDQITIMAKQREILAKVVPTYAEAAMQGCVELSTTPYYHPILPLICDTNAGAESTPGLPLPGRRFRRPDDANHQIQRAIESHQKTFGARPLGLWPSEGSVSEEVLALAHKQGIQWMATDEGVLGRTINYNFARDGSGRLHGDSAEQLYNFHRYEQGDTRMHMIFRDHTLSDLIGFVYSGMPAQDAANHLIHSIRESARPVLERGRDAVVSIILDGENAWEYYPKSGREFLRRFYDGLQQDPGIEAVTISEAIKRHKDFGKLTSLVPGSWISANFNVWIGAPEDNRAWDYLYHAREFYAQTAASATQAQRKLAFEEILIAEGSDWNWWYGPEHHSANDRDFDELYRTHLSNVYQALGGTPPDYLAQPIAGAPARPSFTPQSAYIHPKVTADMVRYFEWMGAARYTSDRRSGAMHGKQFLLDAVYAGIDEQNVYGRMDFAGKVPQDSFELVVNLESWARHASKPRREVRLGVEVEGGRMKSWKATVDQEVLASSERPAESVRVALLRNFEFRLALSSLLAAPLEIEKVRGPHISELLTTKLRVRFSLWRDYLPVDALPVEGWIELELLEEGDLLSLAL